MPRLAVLGHPVAHSRSPAMQNAALAELGLGGEWSYEAIEVVPEHFAALVASLPDDGFAGVNVTVPHKLAALELADEASAAAREIGAANTLSFTRGAGRADNTDAAGIIGAIGAPARGMRALVLGAGGSARAAIWALRNAGAEVSIWNRTDSKAEALAAEFDVGDNGRERGTRIGDFDLVVNATTLGLAQASYRPPTPGDLKALPLRCRCDQCKTNRRGPRLRVVRDGARLPCTGARRTRDRRARGAGPPGSRLAADLDRARTPDRDDAQGGSRAGPDGRPPRTPAPRPHTGCEATAPSSTARPTAPPG